LVLTCIACNIFGGFGQDCENTFPDGSGCPADNAVHRMADPDDCTSYWWCLGSETCPEKKKCERNYLFSEQENLCIDQNRVDCGNRPCQDPLHCPSEHPTTPTAPPTTTPCDHQLDCSGLADGWYPDQYNCRKYWHCYQGEGEHLICDTLNGVDLMYNAEGILCDYPERVQCGDRPICNVCDDDCYVPSTTSPRPTCQHDCSTGDGLFAEECCGHLYCQCFGGQGFILDCGDLFFHQETQTCDWAFNIPCCNAE